MSQPEIIQSDVMTYVVNSVRPSGIPTYDEMNSMTDKEKMILYEQQKKIIERFRQNAESVITEMQSKLLSLLNQTMAIEEKNFVDIPVHSSSQPSKSMKNMQLKPHKLSLSLKPECYPRHVHKIDMSVSILSQINAKKRIVRPVKPRFNACVLNGAKKYM